MITDDMLRKAIKMRLQGFTWRAIAAEIGVGSPGYLSRKTLAEADRLIRIVGPVR